MNDLDPDSQDDKLFETEPTAPEGAASFSAQAAKDKFLGGSSSTPDSKPSLPGKPLIPRPIRIGNNVYSGEDPPKLYQNLDGTTEYRGGTKLDQKAADEVYAARFWNRKQPTTLKATMVDLVHEAATERGWIGSFIDPKTGITDEDREKLSAYRQMADELGYEVGQYKFNKDTDVASATITKKPDKA